MMFGSYWVPQVKPGICTWLSLAVADAEVSAATGRTLAANHDLVWAATGRYRLPKSPAHQTALAAILCDTDFVASKQAIWLHVFDEDVFERPENTLLMQLARIGMGERRALQDCPVCRVPASDLLYASVLIQMVEFFRWSCHLIQPSGFQALISHDGYFIVNSPEPVREMQINSKVIPEFLRRAEG